MGTHARVTPEGLTISIRLVTSKVRHLASPEGSAAMEICGSLSPAAAAAPTPAFRNVRRSIKQVPLCRRAVNWKSPPNPNSERRGVQIGSFDGALSQPSDGSMLL